MDMMVIMVTELLDHLKKGTTFIIDADGKRTAVIVRIDLWERLLALLERFFLSGDLSREDDRISKDGAIDQNGDRWFGSLDKRVDSLEFERSLRSEWDD